MDYGITAIVVQWVQQLYRELFAEEIQW